MSRVDSFRVLFLLLIGTLAAGGCDGDQNPAGPSRLSTLATHTLTVAMSPPAGGSIAKSPNLSQFASGASVTLTATPASGYQFTGWQGDANGSTNPVTVKMDRNKTVTAAFAPVAPNQYTVTVSASPSDAGTIARAPDQPQYPAGTTVTLTATPASGHQFAGWQGDATGSTNPIALTIDKNKSVTAAFTLTAPDQYTVVVSASPANGGTVTRAPDQAQYPAGTTVTLTATPTAGYRLSGWQGDASGTTNPATVIANANKSVTAAFALIPGPSVSAPSTVTGNPASYDVSVTYSSSLPGSGNDRMELEESTGNAAFTVVTSRSGITNPWIVSLTRSPGTYQYRVRVYLGALSGYSPYSSTVLTIVQAPSSSTAFFNDTQDAFPIISLKIDGVEKLPHPNEIRPEQSLEIEVAPGSHSYTTVHGYVHFRQDLYTRSGSYTQPEGPHTIRVRGRTLEDLLTPYSWTGVCSHDDKQEQWRSETYRFFSGGVFRLYVDGRLALSGSFTFVAQSQDVVFEADRVFLLHVPGGNFWVDISTDENQVLCSYDRSEIAPSQQANRFAHFAGEALGVGAPEVAPGSPMRRTGWWNRGTERVRSKTADRMDILAPRLTKGRSTSSRRNARATSGSGVRTLGRVTSTPGWRRATS